MSAIVIRTPTQDGAGATSTANSRAPARPGASVAGDLLLIAICWSGASVTLTAPASWNLVVNNAQTNDNLAVYWRTSDGTSTDTPTLSLSALCTCIASLCAFGNWNGTAPGSANVHGGAASTTITYPAITPKSPGDLLVYLTGLRPGAATTQVSAVAPAGGTGAAIVTQVDGCTSVSGSAESEQAVLTQQLSQATAVTQQAATVSASSSSNIEALVITPAQPDLGVAKPGPAWRQQYKRFIVAGSWETPLAASAPVSDADASAAGADAQSLVIQDASVPADGSTATAEASQVSLSDSDACAGADGASISVSDSQTASAAESVPQITPSTGTGDTGSGAEGSPAIAATLSDTDAAASAEAHLVSLSNSETAAAAEAEAVSVLVSDTDAASSAEAHQVSVSSADSAASAEASSITATLSDTDSASGQDAHQVGIPAGDTASAAEDASIAASFASSDTATAAEAQQVAPGGTDTGTGAEAQQVAAASSDTGTGAEAQQVAPGGTDTATAAEAQQVAPGGADASTSAEAGAVLVPAADTGTAGEAQQAALSSADVAGSAEAASVAAALTSSDTGAWQEAGQGTSLPLLVTSGVPPTISLSGADSGQGADGRTNTPVSSADTGAFNESEIVYKADADTATAAEAQAPLSVTAATEQVATGEGQLPPFASVVPVAATDTATGTDRSLSNWPQDSDSVAGNDQALIAWRSDSDSASGQEAVTSVAVASTDTAGAADAVRRTHVWATIPDGIFLHGGGPLYGVRAPSGRIIVSAAPLDLRLLRLAQAVMGGPLLFPGDGDGGSAREAQTPVAALTVVALAVRLTAALDGGSETLGAAGDVLAGSTP